MKKILKKTVLMIAGVAVGVPMLVSCEGLLDSAYVSTGVSTGVNYPYYNWNGYNGLWNGYNGFYGPYYPGPAPRPVGRPVLNPGNGWTGPGSSGVVGRPIRPGNNGSNNGNNPGTGVAPRPGNKGLGGTNRPGNMGQGTGSGIPINTALPKLPDWDITTMPAGTSGLNMQQKAPKPGSN